jgi:DNA-binding HxlR family transcriptional regulator
MAQQVALVDECGVAYAMSVLGGKWKMAIIWKLLGGTMRFAELRRELVDVAEGVLITQLKDLERDGLVVRRALDRVPPHVEYSLSPRTLDLEPALRVLDHWGDAHRPG